MVDAVLFSSEETEWETPANLFAALNEEFQFTLDPFASHKNHKCERYFTREDNGLIQPWKGKRVFMNPPYGDPEYPCKTKCKKKRCPERGYCITEYQPGIIDFMRKAFEEKNEAELIVALVPARTCTEWFHEYVNWCCEIRFIRGRLHFGGSKNSAPFPSMLVIYRKET